jgi:hypothetical protein
MILSLPVYNYRQISSLSSLIGLVYSIEDLTEQVIQRMIEGIQKMIRVNNNDSQQEPEVRISSAAKRHLEREIKTLQNAPRDENKLREELLKLKEKENEQEATHMLKIFKG